MESNQAERVGLARDMRIGAGTLASFSKKAGMKMIAICYPCWQTPPTGLWSVLGRLNLAGPLSLSVCLALTEAPLIQTAFCVWSMQ